jgi:radical SAM superfamily enzyme YgiQ (UPF0313 family)
MRHLDEEAARLMFEGGVEEVRLGYESEETDFHRDHDAGGSAGDKGSGVDLKTAVERLLGAGFSGSQVGVYVLAGLPGQYRDEVEHSVRAAGSLGVNVFVSEFSPVPGSALWDRSAALSRFPIAEEPLYQNNSLLPLAWDGFTEADLSAVKELAAAYRRGELTSPRAPRNGPRAAR